MEIDPLDTVKEEIELTEDSPAVRKRQRLNNAVAITIALLATFMGICKVKDENIVQAMQVLQADRIDYWSWYQARNVRKEVLAVAAEEVRALRLVNPQIDHAAVDELAARFEKTAQEQSQKMDDLKAKGTEAQKAYEAWDFHDDQFDLMEAALSIAISLLAITSLTQIVWLYWLSLVPASIGVLMGISGMAGWSLHPDILIRLLGI